MHHCYPIPMLYQLSYGQSLEDVPRHHAAVINSLQMNDIRPAPNGWNGDVADENVDVFVRHFTQLHDTLAEERPDEPPIIAIGGHSAGTYVAALGYEQLAARGLYKGIPFAVLGSPAPFFELTLDVFLEKYAAEDTDWNGSLQMGRRIGHIGRPLPYLPMPVNVFIGDHEAPCLLQAKDFGNYWPHVRTTIIKQAGHPSRQYLYAQSIALQAGALMEQFDSLERLLAEKPYADLQDFARFLQEAAPFTPFKDPALEWRLFHDRIQYALTGLGSVAVRDEHSVQSRILGLPAFSCLMDRIKTGDLPEDSATKGVVQTFRVCERPLQSFIRKYLRRLAPQLHTWREDDDLEERTQSPSAETDPPIHFNWPSPNPYLPNDDPLAFKQGIPGPF